jgi:hypothetical protein
MALNFPTSPSIGQIYAGGVNSSTWVWNGQAWVIYSREYGIDWSAIASTGLPRFITQPTNLPAGKQAVVWDLWVIDNYSVDAGTNTYPFGSSTVTDDALLNIRTTLNITGSFTNSGIVNMIF